MRRFLLVWAVVCLAVGLAIVATSGLGMPDFHDPANQTGSLARRAGADTADVLLWVVVPLVLGFLVTVAPVAIFGVVRLLRRRARRRSS